MTRIVLRTLSSIYDEADKALFGHSVFIENDRFYCYYYFRQMQGFFCFFLYNAKYTYNPGWYLSEEYRRILAITVALKQVVGLAVHT